MDATAITALYFPRRIESLNKSKIRTRCRTNHSSIHIHIRRYLRGKRRACTHNHLLLCRYSNFNQSKLKRLINALHTYTHRRTTQLLSSTLTLSHIIQHPFRRERMRRGQTSFLRMYVIHTYTYVDVHTYIDV